MLRCGAQPVPGVISPGAGGFDGMFPGFWKVLHDGTQPVLGVISPGAGDLDGMFPGFWKVLRCGTQAVPGVISPGAAFVAEQGLGGVHKSVAAVAAVLAPPNQPVFAPAIPGAPTFAKGPARVGLIRLPAELEQRKENPLVKSLSAVSPLSAVSATPEPVSYLYTNPACLNAPQLASCEPAADMYRPSAPQSVSTFLLLRLLTLTVKQLCLLNHQSN